MANVEIHDMRQSDVDQIVAIIKETRLGFMSHMPRAFIRFYYRNIPMLDHWYCRVLANGDDVQGFYVLTIGKQVPRYQPLLSSFWTFLLISILWVKPCFVLLHYYIKERRIVETHKRLRAQYDCELVYLGIDARHQNQGLGFRALCDMRRTAEAAGATMLGTEFFKDDELAARFYAKYGYEKLGEIATGGRMSFSIRYPVDRLPVDATGRDSAASPSEGPRPS